MSKLVLMHLLGAAFQLTMLSKVNGKSAVIILSIYFALHAIFSIVTYGEEK